MLSINTNLSSLIAQGSMKSSTNKLNQAIERMTTGFKINHAKDNAANYSISTNMTTKIGAYAVAEDNAAMGLDLISTAEGTLSQIEDKLQRLRALAEQASNGTYGEQSLNAINAEANALVDEINRLYSTAEYNGIKLFDQETQIPDDPNIPKAQYDGFIKEVVKRDTSTMTTLASVDGSADLADGTYSISTPEEMKKLADMTNAGLISAGDEFVLANDIDLSQYENWTPIGDSLENRFYGVFDGNGYTVSNLKISNTGSEAPIYLALFSYVTSGTIKNLGVDNAQVDVFSHGAVLAGRLSSSAIVDNCYARGRVTAHDMKEKGNASGLISETAMGATISNCSFEGAVLGNRAAGLANYVVRTNIINSYVDADIFGVTFSTGVVAGLDNSSISNCALYSELDSLTSVFAYFTTGANPVIENCVYSSFYSDMNIPLISETRSIDVSLDTLVAYETKNSDIELQIGINSKNNSRIGVNLTNKLNNIEFLRSVGTFKDGALTYLDKMLAQISEKQTHFGAASNRLESVLEEITIQRDNLVSSRSTIRDADIAEVSSHYIQQQILQQASATLLATANQSPSIALQLI